MTTVLPETEPHDRTSAQISILGKSKIPKKESPETQKKAFFKNVQSLPSHNLDKSRLLYPAKSRTIPQNLEQPRTISLITDPQRNPQYRTISNDLANHRPPTEPIILCYLAEISFSSTIESLLTPSPQGEGRRLWGPRREAAFDESPHSASRTLTQPGKRRINYPSPPWGGRAKVVGDPLLARQRSMCTPTLGRTDKQNLLIPNPVTGKEGALTEPNPRRGAAKEELATSYPGSPRLAPLSGTFIPQSPGLPFTGIQQAWN